MANGNYNPNTKYDNGPAAAGSSGITFSQVTLAAGTEGLASDGALNRANHRVGFNAAGVPKGTNIGPNAIGQPRSVNGT